MTDQTQPTEQSKPLDAGVAEILLKYFVKPILQETPEMLYGGMISLTQEQLQAVGVGLTMEEVKPFLNSNNELEFAKIFRAMKTAHEDQKIKRSSQVPDGLKLDNNWRQRLDDEWVNMLDHANETGWIK